MPILKNSYGTSIAFDPSISGSQKLGALAGSSLDRKPRKKHITDPIKELIDKSLLDTQNDDAKYKMRSMSRRTKSKIRKKVIAFSRITPRISFLTLTFVNEVQDKIAIKVLHEFLDNVGKRSQDFQYLWVAERQTKNRIFPNNIHFHIVNNKFWKISTWWDYWNRLQEKHGIKPRQANFKASSSFDVKNIHTNHIKGVVNYLTKYVTKNSSQFDCQVWNCSKKISQLYTDFYSDFEILREFQRLEANGLLGGELKTYGQQYCNVHIVPLNRTTLKFYSTIDEGNRVNWLKKNKENEK